MKLIALFITFASMMAVGFLTDFKFIITPFTAAIFLSGLVVGGEIVKEVLRKEIDKEETE